jgi:2-amino-4-hydroxy-6-hydroxymethyldihydropteridine diphosphokinase
MAIAYLGLGTNIGNKRRNMITAAALLAERVGDVLALSGFYETEPWGFESENFFLNAAVKLKTSFPPLELLQITQQIEKELGRAEKSNGVKEVFNLTAAFKKKFSDSKPHGSVS